jgi:hypothetical protein
MSSVRCIVWSHARLDHIVAGLDRRLGVGPVDAPREMQDSAAGFTAPESAVGCILFGAAIDHVLVVVAVVAANVKLDPLDCPRQLVHSASPSSFTAQGHRKHIWRLTRCHRRGVDSWIHTKTASRAVCLCSCCT